MLNDNMLRFCYMVFVIRAVRCDIFEILVGNLGIKDVERSMSCVKHERLRSIVLQPGLTSWYPSGSDMLLYSLLL